MKLQQIKFRIILCSIIVCCCAFAAFGQNTDKLVNARFSVTDVSTDVLNKEDILKANELIELGDKYIEQSQQIKAVECFAKALSIYQSANNLLGQTKALFRLGDVYSKIGQLDFAIEHYENALEISRKIDSADDAANALTRIGYAYLDLGIYDKAFKYFEQALPDWRKLKNRSGEAEVLNYFAIGYDDMGQYDKAIEYFQKALAIFRELDLKFNMAAMLTNIGITYQKIGSYNKALGLIEEAHKLSDGKYDWNLIHLATAYSQVGRFDEAEALFEKVFPLLRKSGGGVFTVIALNNYGTMFYRQKKYEQAILSHKQALELSRSLKLRIWEADALNNLGRDYFAQNKFDAATEHFEKALVIYREIKRRGGEADALAGLMQSWQKRGKKSLAVFYGKQAVNFLQETRRDIAKFEKEAQVNFINDNEKTYRQLYELLVSAGRLAEAEQIANLLKQEEYFDYLKRDPNDPNARTKNTALTAEEEKARAAYLKQAGKITELGRRVEELTLKRPRTPEENQQLVLLQQDLDTTTKEFQEFLQKLVEQFPDTKAGGEQSLRVEDSEAFMNTLGELGTLTGQPGRVAAIYTVVGEKQISLMVVTSQNRVAETVDISEEELNLLIGEFRAALRDKNVDPRPLGAKLYNLIFAPIEKHILPLTHKSENDKTEEVITLMWSLDGTLRYVPIAALWDAKRKQYLVERFRSTVFTFKSKDKLTSKPDDNWSALGLGVSEGRTESGVFFNSLPEVKSELSIIADETKPDKTKPLSGKVLADKDFKLDAMRTEIAQKRPVIHIASHFSFAPTNDDESFLLLGEGKWTVKQMRGIGQIFSGVQLLTLSACNTAMGGRDLTGKEVDGFGTFAQDKGAQAVIATLWAVADDSTSELMRNFYNLRSGDDSLLKAEALRRAQIDLIYGKYAADKTAKNRGTEILELSGKQKQPDFKTDDNLPFAHPYFWSPFVLIGNWR